MLDVKMYAERLYHGHLCLRNHMGFSVMNLLSRDFFGDYPPSLTFILILFLWEMRWYWCIPISIHSSMQTKNGWSGWVVTSHFIHQSTPRVMLPLVPGRVVVWPVLISWTQAHFSRSASSFESSFSLNLVLACWQKSMRVEGCVSDNSLRTYWNSLMECKLGRNKFRWKHLY